VLRPYEVQRLKAMQAMKETEERENAATAAAENERRKPKEK
jgi:hypothetical protein